MRAYHRGIDKDPSAADPELGSRLGIRPSPSNEDPSAEFSDEDEVVDGRVRSSWEAPAEGPLVEVERPGLKFDGVGGMDDVKEEIRLKIIHPLDHPELYQAYGKAIGGGVLLYGPPGCGKTLFARATAGEIRVGLPFRRAERRVGDVDRQ